MEEGHREETQTPEEAQTAVTEAEPAETASQTPKKRRPWIGVLVVCGLLAATFAAVFATPLVILFRHGIFLRNAESVTLTVSGNEVNRLGYFSNLKQADLRGSACFKEIAEWAWAHPETGVLYTVDLPSGMSFDEGTGTLDMTRLTYDETLRAAEDYMQYIPGIAGARLNARDWTKEQLEQFRKQYPDIVMTGEVHITDAEASLLKDLTEQFPDMTVTGSVKVGGVSVPVDAERADLSKMKADGFAALEEAVTALPRLKQVDFGSDKQGHARLKQIAAFMEANPDVETAYTFTAFGKEIDIHADKLDFNHIEMDDQGKEVREILSCMPDVTFLDMDFCGVDDEHMAKIRDDFPDVKVVWRIWFGTNYSVRTDVEKILASAPQVGGMLTPETTKSLIYCTDLKYLDIGHNEGLKDLYFVRYMPKLEVLICMWGSITDISPLADCPHLEFLEIFTNSITDISPLKDLHELKHLNMCWNLGLTDLSPIYGLTQLERLWIGTTTGIPRDQIEKFKELVPDCEVNDWCGDPHTNWRWGTERYALLQEQFGYVNYEYEFYWRDPLYYPHDDKDENADDGKT